MPIARRRHCELVPGACFCRSPGRVWRSPPAPCPRSSKSKDRVAALRRSQTAATSTSAERTARRRCTGPRTKEISRSCGPCSSGAPMSSVRNDYGATAISAAAVEGDYQIIEALLDAGADVDSPNAEGQTVLMVVARTGQVSDSPLAARAWRGRQRRGAMGRSNGADVGRCAEATRDGTRTLIEHGAAVDASGHAHDWQRKVTAEPRIKIMHTGGFTPLLYAAREGCGRCVEELAKSGADPVSPTRSALPRCSLALLTPAIRYGGSPRRARRRRQSMGLVGPQPVVSRHRAQSRAG